MKFDEIAITKNMEEFTIAFVNEAKFSPDRPMGNVARSLVEFIVSAAFVGLFSDVQGSLDKCKKWLRDAIERGEDFGSAPQFHIYRLHEALGIANWLSGDMADGRVWKDALRAELRAAHGEHAYLPRDMKTLRLDQFMPVALLAGEHGLAKAEYEASVDAGTVSRGRAVPPRKFAYFIASHWEGLDEGREETFVWGRKVLAKNLDDWISRGHYITAAKWVLFVYSLVGDGYGAVEALTEALYDAKSAHQ